MEGSFGGALLEGLFYFSRVTDLLAYEYSSQGYRFCEFLIALSTALPRDQCWTENACDTVTYYRQQNLTWDVKVTLHAGGP